MNVVYRTAATSTGDGRNGHSASSDGVLSVDLATPAEQGGPGGATNPEQLFAAGWAGCFHSAIKAVARREKVALRDTSVTVEVDLVKDEAGAFSLCTAIRAALPGLEAEQARHLLHEAHQRCPYSKATRGDIDVRLVLP